MTDVIKCMNFNEKQCEELEWGLIMGIDINLYKNENLSAEQMREIRMGLQSNMDVSIYDKPEFDDSQMSQIRRGIKHGLDVSIYAKPEFDDSQMSQIRRGIKHGLDVSIYAKPEFNWEQMREIKEGLENNVDVTIYADPRYDHNQMYEIKEGLIDGLDLTELTTFETSANDIAIIRVRCAMNKYRREAETAISGDNYLLKHTFNLLNESDVSLVKADIRFVELFSKYQDALVEFMKYYKTALIDAPDAVIETPIKNLSIYEQHGELKGLSLQSNIKIDCESKNIHLDYDSECRFLYDIPKETAIINDVSYDDHEKFNRDMVLIKEFKNIEVAHNNIYMKCVSCK